MLLAAAACNPIFGLNETVPPDGPPPPIGCSGKLFGSPVSLPPLVENEPEFDGQLGADGRELWMVAREPVTQAFRAYRSLRAPLDSDFPLATKVELAPGRSVTDPSLATDGRRIMFVSRVPTDVVLEAVRETPDGAFGAPALISGLGSISVAYIDLSFDGLTVYYGNFAGDLWTASRATVDEPFVDARMLMTNIARPSVSPDQLELFYGKATSPGGPIYRRLRPAVSEPFGPDETVVVDRGGDPDVSPDSRTLVISDLGGLTLLTRECP